MVASGRGDTSPRLLDGSCSGAVHTSLVDILSGHTSEPAILGANGIRMHDVFPSTDEFSAGFRQGCYRAVVVVGIF